MPLLEFEEGVSPRTLSPGETLRWSTEIENARRKLADHGTGILPVFALPRPGGLLYRALPRTGMVGAVAAGRLRELGRWRLAVELADARGARRKVGVEFAGPWEPREDTPVHRGS